MEYRDLGIQRFHEELLPVWDQIVNSIPVIEAATPTEAEPGTAAKVAILSRRVALGLPLWLDEDRSNDGRQTHSAAEEYEERGVWLDHDGIV
jgi:hypothetical protein